MARLALKLAIELVDGVPVGPVKPHHARPPGSEGQRRDQRAEGGGDTGAGREDDCRTAEHARDRNGVRRSRAAERDRRQRARIAVALDDVDTRGSGHVLVDDAMDAPGGVLDRQPNSSASRSTAARARSARSGISPPRK